MREGEENREEIAKLVEFSLFAGAFFSIPLASPVL
jgi:hypothetical protein